MPQPYQQLMIESYNFLTFSQVWENAVSFRNDYINCGIPHLIDDKIDTLYYLLYAQYGDSPMSFENLNLFKYNVFSIVFEYGPAWSQRLNFQNRLATATEDEILQGSTQMFNSAKNPSNAVTGIKPQTQEEINNQTTKVLSREGTLTRKELGAINQQSTTLNQRSLLDAYALLDSVLRTDVTREFIKKFEKLFCVIANKQRTPMYISED